MEEETCFEEQNYGYQERDGSDGEDSHHDERENGYREKERGYRERDASFRKRESRYREKEPRYREHQETDLYGRGSGAVCCFLLITLIIGAVSTAGLILSIISFVEGESREHVDVQDNRPYPTMDDDGDDNYQYEEFIPGPYNSNEVWLIQVGYDGSNVAYLDPINGQIKGYDIDVVNAVCRKANKNCRLVLDSYSRCWSGGYSGEGLIDRWYHACTGWKVTQERIWAVKFSDAFSPNNPGFLVTASGSSGFDWTNLGGSRIGFLEGWFTNANCLNSQDSIQGLPLNDDQIIIYGSPDSLESALVSGEVDAVFIDEVIELITRHNIVSTELTCSLDGSAMMMRKDTHLDKWWNPAWKALLKSDEYREICDDIGRIHGNQPGPRKEDLCRENWAGAG